MNRQQLFSRIGKTYPVLYSNGAWYTWDRFSPDWNGTSWSGRIRRQDNVWVDEPPRFFMRRPQTELWDELITQLQCRRWKRWAQVQNYGPLVAYVFHPMFFPYIGKVRPDYVVYHAYDMHDHAGGWNEHLESHERELLRKANMVIVSSEQIRSGLQRKVPREIRVLPNGADVAAFSDPLRLQSVPEDLLKIPRPRLGYTGAINRKVDWDLIACLAGRRPDWHFIFIGQVISNDAKSEASRATCAGLPNVHFLGEKAVNEVPRYVANMDVNLMCYVESEKLWTAWGYPLKLHEYLAAGLPVVSSSLPSVHPFADVVQIASGADAWEHAIKDALLRGGQGTPESRRIIAASNTWDDRVVRLQQWLNELIQLQPVTARDWSNHP